MTVMKAHSLSIARRNFDHEIRTSLAVAHGAIHLLNKEYPTPEQQQYIGCIEQAIQRLLAFADNVTAQAAPPILSTDNAKKQSAQLYILLVEDDPLVELINKKNLVDLGCCVDTAKTGEQAIKMAIANSYHVIFMDVGLPGISGIEATAAIRRQKRTPIIGLTAYSEEQIQTECKTAGMDEVMVKPIQQQRLEKLLKNFSAFNKKN